MDDLYLYHNDIYSYLAQDTLTDSQQGNEDGLEKAIKQIISYFIAFLLAIIVLAIGSGIYHIFFNAN